MTTPDVHEQAHDPAAGLAAALTPDEQLDLLEVELDQRHTRRVAREAAAADRAKARGGPCRYCGCTESWPRRPGRGRWHQTSDAPIYWHQTSAGPACVPCWATVQRLGGAAAGDDVEHRAKAARLVLGDTPAPPRAGHGPLPAARFWHDGYLAAAFKWFSEVPGAQPAQGGQRFAYTSAQELLARLYPPPPAPQYERGPKCPRCKTRDRWRVERRPVDGQPYSNSDKVVPGYFEVTRTCWGRDGACRYQPEPERDYGAAPTG
jgi:hypothetical protein